MDRKIRSAHRIEEVAVYIETSIELHISPMKNLQTEHDTKNAQIAVENMHKLHLRSRSKIIGGVSSESNSLKTSCCLPLRKRGRNQKPTCNDHSPGKPAKSKHGDTCENVRDQKPHCHESTGSKNHTVTKTSGTNDGMKNTSATRMSHYKLATASETDKRSKVYIPICGRDPFSQWHK